jgi:NADH-quinone oxidoreductase subunit A
MLLENYNELGLHGFWAVIGFLGVPAIGLAYEWKRGVLEWESPTFSGST